MVLTTDQQRVKTLLKDTIALLCKNGLTFNMEFSIDAVIGVTLDNQSLFYMSFNETIKSGKQNEEVNDNFEDDLGGFMETPVGPSPRKKRRRHHREPLESGDESIVRHNVFPDGNELYNIQETLVKREIQETEPDNDVIEPVIVKREQGDDWQISATELTDNSFASPGMSTDGGTLLPGGIGPLDDSMSGDLSGTWAGTDTSAQGTALSVMRLQGENDQNMKIGLFNTSLFEKSMFLSPNYLQTPSDGQLGSRYYYQCKLCFKMFSCPDNLKGHMANHTGVKQFQCSHCGKVYQYKSTLQRHQQMCPLNKLSMKTTDNIPGSQVVGVKETENWSVSGQVCETDTENQFGSSEVCATNAENQSGYSEASATDADIISGSSIVCTTSGDNQSEHETTIPVYSAISEGTDPSMGAS